MTAVINDASPEGLGNTRPPVRAAGTEAMPGRDAERQVVRQLLRRAERGLGGVLLVDGEPGIGKSLLLRASSSEAAGQCFSLAAGAADQLGRTIPFFALRVALREPFSELPAEADLDLPDTPVWWINRLRAHLEQRAVVAPVLVTLDDLQWASRGTLAVLRTLPRELKRHPVAWILARSNSRREATEVLFSILEKDGATRITLGPISDDAVADLLADAFCAPPDRSLMTLAAGAAGNPSLLTELIRGLRDDSAVQVADGQARLISAHLPQRIRLVARQRLDRLSGRARHLLVTAAVLGESFRLEDAAEMLSETPAALLPTVEEAMGAGIMTAAEDAFSFRHELLGRAIADMIPRPARKAMHRQYGEILLNRGESAALAAAHLLQAAHPRDPASLAGLDTAAAQALHSSPQTAADLALRALELTSATDPAALSRSVAAAEALTAAGRLEPAARIVQDELARPLPALAEARLRCALSSILCTSGQARDASAEAETILAQPQLPRDLRDQAMIARLQAVAGLRDQAAAEPIADTVLASPGEYGDQVIVAALVTRAVISWDQGRVSEGLEFLREAARRGTGVSADARHFQPLLALAASLVDLGQFDEAARVMQAADNEKLRGIPPEAVLSIVRARISLAKGRLNDAAAEAEAALASARCRAAPGYTSLAQCVLAVIELRRGDIAAAAQHIASRSARTPHFADIYARSETIVAEAQITEARDGPAVALGQIRDLCADLPARPGLLLGEPATAAWLARTARAAGDDDLAATVAHTADALARNNPAFRAITAAAAHSLGLVSRDPGRLAHAAAQHEDPWPRASAAEDLGVLLASQAGEDQAIKHLGRALDEYVGMGAVIDMARVRSRLRQLGVRRRHGIWSAERPVTGWESLTAAECAIAELVAQGLNNKRIAGRMYVSIHTVTFHLRQIFRKLAIGSRVELARIVIEQGRPPDRG